MYVPSLRRETRYGMPAADQVMFNRHYVLGYSYYFRQAKWALEIVDEENTIPERLDNFRPDYRIPAMFRADLADYAGSGYDRGHLVASADKSVSDIQNSETFLLSNMSPQKKELNRGIWRRLENTVRDLNRTAKILETYVICGPVFYFDQAVETIGAHDPNEVTIPVPHAYFKSVLAEHRNGKLYMWSFLLPNDDCNQPLENYRVSTVTVERLAGIKLWERLEDVKIAREKNRIRKMW